MVFDENFENRLKILVNGAKYDVSCSSSGSSRGMKRGALGDTAQNGICHSYTADGRCISLLKILLSNVCAYDCEYCVNRRSADVPRATLSSTELCELVMHFYRRNYIEGLFLSSAVVGSPDKTMELLIEAVVKLRKIYNFNGYIHLKGIPGADERLIQTAAMYVDRMSFNIELPTEKSLKMLAPQKTKEAIVAPMKQLSVISEEKSLRQIFLPAGQTTQMIVGASGEADGHIIRLSSYLYNKYGMKRVYYSSYVPVVSSPLLPALPTGLLREHRLYQADWLLRFYGFSAEEIVGEGENLPADVDPKEYWALRNISLFPVEINSAPYEILLRIPGVGHKSAAKILSARRVHALDFCDLIKMRVSLKKARHFITCKGKYFGCDKGAEVLRPMLSLSGGFAVNEQLSLFGTGETAYSALLGEV